MDEQRQRAKADSKRKKTGAVDVSAYRAVLDNLGEPVSFIGYHEISGDATVRGFACRRCVGRSGAGWPARRTGAQSHAVLTPRAAVSWLTRA